MDIVLSVLLIFLKLRGRLEHRLILLKICNNILRVFSFIRGILELSTKLNYQIDSWDLSPWILCLVFCIFGLFNPWIAFSFLILTRINIWGIFISILYAFVLWIFSLLWMPSFYMSLLANFLFLILILILISSSSIITYAYALRQHFW